MPAYPVEISAKTTRLPCGSTWSTKILLERIWEATGADIAGECAFYLCPGCHEFHYLRLCSTQIPPVLPPP